jgi:hypothetical protein
MPASVLKELRYLGEMEFDPPPSPPRFKFASTVTRWGFFVAKNVDGEIRGYLPKSELPVYHFFISGANLKCVKIILTNYCALNIIEH